MLKSYQRRAFLLYVLVAAEPASVAAHAQQIASSGLTAHGIDAPGPRLPAPAAETASLLPTRPTDATLAVSGTLTPEPETLWDALSRIDRNANAAAAAAAAGPTRLPLGTVPGFTVPASPRAKLVAAALQPKQKRGNSFGLLGNWFDKFQRATGSSIKAQGSATLSFRQDNISGGAAATDAYQQDNYLGRGGNGIYTDANMHIDATLFNSFHYSTDINNNLYSRPDSNRFKIEYKTKSAEMQLGDINAGFQGNSLIDFSRYLSGVQMTNHWSKQLQTSVLFARTKADPQTRVIQGNNSSGPYFVFSGQIVEGSVHVRVDNVDKQQGKDYTLDPISGQLNFLNGYVVLQTSSIAVSYETLNYGQSAGGVYGFRTELLPNSTTKFGMTYVTQQSKGSAVSTSRTEQFYGNISPLSAYLLQYTIDTSKIALTSVTVNGVPQAQGIDYKIDTTNYNQIYITHGLATTDIVNVVYYPANVDPTPGNRSVVGLDGKFALGRIGSMSLETAFSGVSITGKGINGQAWQARFNLTPAKNLRTDIVLKNVGPSFSSIQSPGFNRNEKSLQINSEYSPFRTLRLSLSWEKAKRPSYAYSGTTTSQFTVNTNGNDTYDQYTLGASWNFAKNATLNLNRNSFGTTYIVGGKSNSINDTLAVNYTIGKVGLDAGLTRNNSFSDSINSVSGLTTLGTGTNYATTSNTLSKHAGITWNPAHWFRMTGSFSDNDTTNSGAGVTATNNGTGLLAHTNSRDTQLTSTFDLSRNLKMEYGLTFSDTGNLGNTTTGTTTTGTTGTTSTGTTSSTTTTGITSSGTSVTRVFEQFFAPWQFAHGITRDALTAGGGSNSSLGSTGNYGGVLGNTSGTTYTGSSIGGRSVNNRFNIAYSPTSRLRTSLGFDQSSSLGDYLYNSNRNTTTLGIDYALTSRMHFNVNYNVQKVAYTGGLGNTNSNTLTFDFEGRPFGNKLNIRLGWQSVRNRSLLNQTALNSSSSASGTSTGTTTSLLNTSTDLGSYIFHADYPIGLRMSIFLDLSSSITSGYQPNTLSDTRFGLDFALTQALKFSLGWQLSDRTNASVASSTGNSSSSSLNYRTSSLLAEFGLRF